MTHSEKNLEQYAILNELLRLQYPPVAVKLVETGGEVPEHAYGAGGDGRRLALCQAFALARRDGKTVYMRRENHGCWNPLIALGHVKCESADDPGFDLICSVIGVNDAAAAKRFVAGFPRLPAGKYEGVLLAPLDRAEFCPDIWLVYCDNGQLRTILRAVRGQTGELIKSEFDALDSCMYSIVPPLLNGDYRITLPDPGEHERALTDNNKIIFSVPQKRFEEFINGARQMSASPFGGSVLHREMNLDFPRPPFYDDLFSLWGL
jgi:uncharacterized protein (DUF169 family)